jgi:spore coat polysaccharide biosynthesis protein SpsF
MADHTNFSTEQEAFWAGEFGTAYISRNQGPELLASNLRFFVDALRSARQVGSCLELGANIGMNLQALKLLYPGIETYALEINGTAAESLRKLLGPSSVSEGSIVDFVPHRTWDLVLIKGVLIHTNPEILETVYGKMVQACGRYVLLAEYYNPTPVAIPYRGHPDKLFKRDFAGDLCRAFPALELVDYGFSYHLDRAFPQDDITWFLLEKRDRPHS